MCKVLKLFKNVSVRVPPQSLLDTGRYLLQIFSLVLKAQLVPDFSMLALILGCVNGLCVAQIPASDVAI